jgi:hypothetical protein
LKSGRRLELALRALANEGAYFIAPLFSSSKVERSESYTLEALFTGIHILKP